MNKKRKFHDWNLANHLKAYAKERGVVYSQYNPYHMRLSYDKTAVVDVWTTHKYWVKETNYSHNLTERQGEKGHFPEGKDNIYDFLDKLLFAVEIAEES